MIITLTGPNSYSLRRRYDQLVADFTAEFGSLAIERIDGSDVTAASVREAVQSLPFLAEQKLVILTDSLSNKSLAENIEQIIDSTSPSTTLLVVEPNPDKRSSAYKLLKAKTQFENLENLSDNELSRWLVAEARDAGYTLDDRAADYLVNRVGSDQMLLASELTKLGLYNSAITVDTINLLTDESPQSKIFDLLDAAFNHQPQKAITIYAQQRAQKVEPQAILALIIWQLNIIIIAKLGQGKMPAQIASEAGLSPYPVQKARNLVNHLSLARLQEITREITDIDFRSKSSRLDIDEALKTYIMTL